MTGKKAVTAPPRPRAKASDGSTRERVLTAAFAVFRKRGFSGASTLEIATRAQVSKRDLYALFGSKHAMLTACIRERASRMRQPLESAAPIPSSREAVAATLVELGTSILRVACHPDVLAIHRLAIAETDRAPATLFHPAWAHRGRAATIGSANLPRARPGNVSPWRRDRRRR